MYFKCTIRTTEGDRMVGKIWSTSLPHCSPLFDRRDYQLYISDRYTKHLTVSIAGSVQSSISWETARVIEHHKPGQYYTANSVSISGIPWLSQTQLRKKPVGDKANWPELHRVGSNIHPVATVRAKLSSLGN